MRSWLRLQLGLPSGRSGLPACTRMSSPPTLNKSSVTRVQCTSVIIFLAIFLGPTSHTRLDPFLQALQAESNHKYIYIYTANVQYYIMTSWAVLPRGI